MKKFFILILLTVIAALFFGAASFSEEAKIKDKNPLLEECVKNMSKIQALLEYFYLQSGSYPESLAEMNKSYNVPMDKSVELKDKIEIPKDPATGKDFIYKVDPKNPENYQLMAPEPKLYGAEKLELNAVNWAWMKVYAGEERRKMGISLCIDLLNRLATYIELYAADNKGQFPKTLDVLIKSKPEVAEISTCPASKKKYGYEIKKDGTYAIKCPDPAAHKVKQIEYDSVKGIIGK